MKDVVTSDGHWKTERCRDRPGTRSAGVYWRVLKSGQFVFLAWEKASL